MDIPPVLNELPWPERRQQLLDIFADQLYGATPCDVPLLEVLDDDGGREVDGLICRQLQLGLPQINRRIYVLLWLPMQEDGPLPCFIGLNFRGNHCVHPDPGILFAPTDVPDEPPGWTACRYDESRRGVQALRWPVAEICAKGFAVATVFNGDIAPDNKDLFDQGFAGEYAPGHVDDWRTVSRWAWGLSVLRKNLALLPELDVQRMIAIGHSRLGKTALWAAAQDAAFAMCCVNNSGCNGAAFARRCQGERFRDIGSNFPHWFLPSFNDYFDREAEFPVDQHQLIACVAPRPCYVASGSEDHHADPEGEFTSLRLAAPAWEALGMKPVPADAAWPAPGEHLHADNAYHLREGPHNILSFDWNLYCDYALKHI